MSSQNEKPTLQLAVRNKKAKPNAPTYRLKTIEDIFTHVNPSNKERFLEDLGGMIELFHATNNLGEALMIEKGEPFIPLKILEMDWTDD